jgi:hypothetical protein
MGRLKSNPILGLALLLLATVSMTVFPSVALAAKHLESRLPPPDQNCRIVVSPENDTRQAKRDARRVKRTLDRMIAGSADMRKKVKDACSKNKNTVVIFMGRDNSKFTLGGSNFPLFIFIDLGDISALELAASGKSKDVKKLIDNILIDILAHELDHMRGDDHKDPPANGGKGKPVEDANKVMKQLGIKISRNAYHRLDKTGKRWRLWTEYTVDGQKVMISENIFQEMLWMRKNQKVRTPHDLKRGVIKNIPDGYCSRDFEPCFPRRPDRDGDGILDFYDNCEIWVNPGQQDLDGDGRGHGCDPDDDADGWLDLIENAVGASSVEVSSVPEHWAVATTCSNGRDDDGDGLIDAEDQSCTLPPIDNVKLPVMVPVKAIYPPHLRMDLGGVRENEDTLPVTLVLQLDMNLDSTVDEELTLEGLMVIQRWGDLANTPTDAEPQLALEVLVLELRGHSEALGSLRLSLAPELQSSGAITGINPDPGKDLPASLQFDIYLKLSGEAGVLENTQALPLQGTIHRWPFFDDFLETGADAAPLPLLDANGKPAGHITGSRLKATRP